MIGERENIYLNPNRSFGRNKKISWAFPCLCHLFWFFLTAFSVVLPAKRPQNQSKITQNNLTKTKKPNDRFGLKPS